MHPATGSRAGVGSLQMTVDLHPHLPTQGTENCRVDVARLVLPATASVTTSFWRHANEPAAACHGENHVSHSPPPGRKRLIPQGKAMAASRILARRAPEQQSLLCCATLRLCQHQLLNRRSSKILAADGLLTVPSATHDWSLLLDTTVACAAVCCSTSSSTDAAARPSCAHRVYA
jgi:hypothetical protein